MCKNPYRQGVAEYGCGQCMPCRVNHRRRWTVRLLLEALTHSASFFVTLTYAPEHLPEGGTLVIRDYQLFLKRLRNAGEVFRYYLCGEYGEQNFRPHYHAALFGLRDYRVVEHCWRLGGVHVGDVTAESAHYMLGYITKRMTNAGDSRLAGRHPEFSRMSLKPGIGAPAMGEIVRWLHTREGSKRLVESDLPREIRVGGKKFPLSRYLREVIAREYGHIKSSSWVPRHRPLSEWEAQALVEPREEREGRRIQHSRNIEARVAIQRSKRGL